MRTHSSSYLLFTLVPGLSLALLCLSITGLRTTANRAVDRPIYTVAMLRARLDQDPRA